MFALVVCQSFSLKITCPKRRSRGFQRHTQTSQQQSSLPSEAATETDSTKEQATELMDKSQPHIWQTVDFSDCMYATDRHPVTRNFSRKLDALGPPEPVMEPAKKQHQQDQQQQQQESKGGPPAVTSTPVIEIEQVLQPDSMKATAADTISSNNNQHAASPKTASNGKSKPAAA